MFLATREKYAQAKHRNAPAKKPTVENGWPQKSVEKMQARGKTCFWVHKQKTHSGPNKQNGWRKPLKEPRVVSRTELVKVLSKHRQLCQHNTRTDWLKALK